MCACMCVCVCVCVCVYPERYSPGALSDECRFGRLFKVAVGGRAILRWGEITWDLLLHEIRLDYPDSDEHLLHPRWMFPSCIHGANYLFFISTNAAASPLPTPEGAVALLHWWAAASAHISHDTSKTWSIHLCCKLHHLCVCVRVCVC